MGLIDRYILRSIATPLALSLCVAGMLLLLEHMLRLFDFVLAEQGPVDVVWRMLANLVPHYLSLALPLGAFLGIMLAFRNLSQSSELDALNSSGVSFGRLMRPIYLLLFVLILLDFFLVGYLKPFALYRYDKIRFDVTSGAFGIKIPQGEFIDISDEATIRLGKINPETRDAENIFLELREPKGRRTVITAEYGGISTTPEITRLLLNLRKGRQLFIAASGDAVQSLDFDAFDLEVDLPAIAVFRARGIDAEEATFSEMAGLLRAPDSRSSPLWLPYRASFHWALIHPLTFLLLPILAIAMGVSGRRKSSSIKPVIGIAILIVYHELLQEWGLVTASRGELSPYVSMWGLFAVFALLSIFLYRGSIDKARTAKVMARREDETIRVPAASPEDIRQGAAE